MQGFDPAEREAAGVAAEPPQQRTFTVSLQDQATAGSGNGEAASS
jgi:hypothetical protein